MQREKLKEVFPSIAEEDLQAAQESLERYLEVVWDIMRDIESANGQLDDSDNPGQDSGKVA